MNRIKGHFSEIIDKIFEKLSANEIYLLESLLNYYATTAGITANRPSAVANKASEI